MGKMIPDIEAVIIQSSVGPQVVFKREKVPFPLLRHLGIFAINTVECALMDQRVLAAINSIIKNEMEMMVSCKLLYKDLLGCWKLAQRWWEKMPKDHVSYNPELHYFVAEFYRKSFRNDGEPALCMQSEINDADSLYDSICTALSDVQFSHVVLKMPWGEPKRIETQEEAYKLLVENKEELESWKERAEFYSTTGRITPKNKYPDVACPIDGNSCEGQGTQGFCDTCCLDSKKPDKPIPTE